MVRALRGGRTILILAAVGIAQAAFGLDLLEKMQAEVAAIVKASKGAVVTIEDDVLQMGWSPDERILGEEVNKQVAAAIRQAREELAKIAEGSSEKPNREAQRELRARLRALEHKEEVTQKNLESAREALDQTRMLRMRIPKSGTGFSIGEGHIVTTADVVEGMEKPVVITDDGTRIKAKVTGIDPDLNVAILTVTRRAELPALKWGDSTGAVPGFFAISIGNQTGNLNTAALNLVAGIRDEGTLAGKRFYPRLLQIAGTVGAGFSGAPLLNTKGEVIGMMAAVPSPEMPWTGINPPVPGASPPPPVKRVRGVAFGTGKPQPDADGQPHGEEEMKWLGQQGSFAIIRPPVTSAGFAVPSNDLRPVVEALREGRQATRGYIGVTTLDDQKYESDGEISRLIRIVRIASVVADSPAFKAGLLKNDILVAFNGKAVTDMNEVRAVAMTSMPGQILRVEIKRNGKPMQFEVTIAERPVGVRKHKAKEPMKKGAADPPDIEWLTADDRYTN